MLSHQSAQQNLSNDTADAVDAVNAAGLHNRRASVAGCNLYNVGDQIVETGFDYLARVYRSNKVNLGHENHENTEATSSHRAPSQFHDSDDSDESHNELPVDDDSDDNEITTIAPSTSMLINPVSFFFFFSFFHIYPYEERIKRIYKKNLYTCRFRLLIPR